MNYGDEARWYLTEEEVWITFFMMRKIGSETQTYLFKAHLYFSHFYDAVLGLQKGGYEINFTRYFYQYTPLEPLEQIKADTLALERETEGLLQEILDV